MLPRVGHAVPYVYRKGPHKFKELELIIKMTNPASYTFTKVTLPAPKPPLPPAERTSPATRPELSITH